MPRRSSKADPKGANPFERLPDKAPPNKLARFFGATDLAGAETTIVNFLADVGPDEVTPELVRAVCDQYGVPEAKRDHVIYTIFRAAIERRIKRDALTEDADRLVNRLATSLGIPSDEI